MNQLLLQKNHLDGAKNQFQILCCQELDQYSVQPYLSCFGCKERTQKEDYLSTVLTAKRMTCAIRVQRKSICFLKTWFVICNEKIKMLSECREHVPTMSYDTSSSTRNKKTHIFSHTGRTQRFHRQLHHQHVKYIRWLLHNICMCS